MYQNLSVLKSYSKINESYLKTALEFILIFLLLLTIIKITFFVIYIKKKHQERLQKKNIFFPNIHLKEHNYVNKKLIFHEVIEAIRVLKENKISCLLVFERNDSLAKYYRQNGTILDAVLSKELIISIFNTNREFSSPLHDGAVVIRKNKILAASVFFPIKLDNTTISNKAARFRTALKITSLSDCLTIIVNSESKVFFFKNKNIIEIDNLKHLENLLMNEN